MNELFNFMTSSYGHFWLWTVMIGFLAFSCGMLWGAYIQEKAQIPVYPRRSEND